MTARQMLRKEWEVVVEAAGMGSPCGCAASTRLLRLDAREAPQRITIFEQPRYSGSLTRYSKRRRRALAVPSAMPLELLADNLLGGIFQAIVGHRGMGRKLIDKGW